MPLIEDEPPITLPRGVARRRLFKCGSGSVSKPQLYMDMFIGMDSADGIWISGPMSVPPYSMTATVVFAVFRQAVGQSRARRAGADDHIVSFHRGRVVWKVFACAHSPLGNRAFSSSTFRSI